MKYISVSVTKVAHLDVRCLICDQMVVWKGAVSFLAASRPRTSWQRSWIYRRGVALLKAVAPHAILRTHSQGGLFSKGGKRLLLFSLWHIRLQSDCFVFFFPLVCASSFDMNRRPEVRPEQATFITTHDIIWWWWWPKKKTKQRGLATPSSPSSRNVIQCDQKRSLGMDTFWPRHFCHRFLMDTVQPKTQQWNN